MLPRSRIKFEFPARSHLNSHRQRFPVRCATTCCVSARLIAFIVDLWRGHSRHFGCRCNFRGHDPGSSNEQEKRAVVSERERERGRRTTPPRKMRGGTRAFARNKTRVVPERWMVEHFIPSGGISLNVALRHFRIREENRECTLLAYAWNSINPIRINVDPINDYIVWILFMCIIIYFSI